jgi:hypothetical protein
MRLFLILMISILSLSVNGQTESKTQKEATISLTTSIGNKKAVSDTTLSVEYVKTENIDRQPAYYINGKLSSPTLFRTIDPKLIDSIDVEKREIKGKRDNGQIHLKMKKEYHPLLISLNDLKAKYTNLTKSATIFMIDNDIIKDDYDHYLVDEKFILKIIVDTVESEKEKLNVAIVRLLTKTKENIEKSKEIRLRGSDKTTLN